jgi:hypothetical protein
MCGIMKWLDWLCLTGGSTTWEVDVRMFDCISKLMYLLWNQTCNIYSKFVQCYDTHSRHYTVSEGLNILQDISLQFAVTFSFVIGKVRYFDGVQSGKKHTLYHLLSLLFHVFFWTFVLAKYSYVSKIYFNCSPT